MIGSSAKFLQGNILFVHPCVKLIAREDSFDGRSEGCKNEDIFACKVGRIVDRSSGEFQIRQRFAHFSRTIRDGDDRRKCTAILSRFLGIRGTGASLGIVGLIRLGRIEVLILGDF